MSNFYLFSTLFSYFGYKVTIFFLILHTESVLIKIKHSGLNIKD